MLELQKTVLKAVADNKDLFKKELIKSLGWLNANELTQLRKWVKVNYGQQHSEIISSVFYSNIQAA